jgi:hypothetical protein
MKLIDRENEVLVLMNQDKQQVVPDVHALLKKFVDVCDLSIYQLNIQKIH